MYPVNLSVFRSEAKTEDEREFTCSFKDGLVTIRPNETYPFTVISIRSGEREFEESLYYSHQALARLIAEYEFSNILEIGSRNGTAARAFEFLGKEVTTVEIATGFEADHQDDYLQVDFGKQFDAIWCSHVLEHQRHAGKFLEKLYRDLKEGGVLALTVPSALSPLMIGHCNIYTPLHLIYNLVLAGFDCSEVKSKCYDWQFSIILKKQSNNIPSMSVAAEHMGIDRKDNSYIPHLLNFFPPQISSRMTKDGHIWGEIDSINWD